MRTAAGLQVQSTQSGTREDCALPRGDRSGPGPAFDAPYPPLFLAPMEGVTHPLFRRLVADRGGIDVLCTEFVRVSRAPLSPKALRREVDRVPGVPLSVQVMGNEAARMAEAAAVLSEAGADVIDVNLGCPMPRIVRKGVGAAMLKDLVLLRRVLDAMRRAVPGTLSAKIRAGFDDADHVLEIGRSLEQAGVDFVTVHPRRRADFYAGVADWRVIRLLVDELRIPVVGNGDVWTPAAALRMVEETGCAGVMVGRPALRNPWFFPQAAALRDGRPPIRPDGDTLLAHLRDVRGRYETAFRRRRNGAVGPMKELIRYVGRALPDRQAFLPGVLRSPGLDGVFAALERRLGGVPADGLDLTAEGHLGLERSGSVGVGIPPADAQDNCAEA